MEVLVSENWASAEDRSAEEVEGESLLLCLNEEIVLAMREVEARASLLMRLLDTGSLEACLLPDMLLILAELDCWLVLKTNIRISISQNVKKKKQENYLL